MRKDTIEIRRQAVHAAGVLMAVLVLFVDRPFAVAVISAILAFFLLWAVWRKTVLYKIRIFRPLERIAEYFVSAYERPAAPALYGAITFFTGALVAVLLFGKMVAAAAIAVLAIADAAATLIGYYFGTHKLLINRAKSLEGSIIFFLAAAAVLLVFVSPIRAALTATAVALVETLPGIDDNISIPIATGAMLTILYYLNI
jgi:dolichol kinase